MSEVDEMSAGSRGSQPVAWAVEDDAGLFFADVDLRGCEILLPSFPRGRVVPLYRWPTLTEAERQAIENAINWLERWQQRGGYHSSVSDDAEALRGLLERLG